MAEAECQAPRQGYQPVAKYTTEFQFVVADIEWNEAMQCYLFPLGLNNEIKDELA